MACGPFRIIGYHDKPDNQFQKSILDATKRISLLKLADRNGIDLVPVWRGYNNYAPVTLRYYKLAPYKKTIWQCASQDPFYSFGRRHSRALIECATLSCDVSLAFVLAVLANQSTTYCEFRRLSDPIKRCFFRDCIGCSNHLRFDFHGFPRLSFLMVSFS